MTLVATSSGRSIRNEADAMVWCGLWCVAAVVQQRGGERYGTTGQSRESHNPLMMKRQRMEKNLRFLILSPRTQEQNLGKTMHKDLRQHVDVRTQRSLSLGGNNVRVKLNWHSSHSNSNRRSNFSDARKFKRLNSLSLLSHHDIWHIS